MQGGLKFSGGASNIETVEIVFFREIPYFHISPNGINATKKIISNNFCVVIRNLKIYPNVA